MAKQKRPIAETQLNFLTELSRLPLGEVVPVPIWDDGIGGELLNILSKGLYTNPLDAIREYVQNSIDADADTVEILVTGNSVSVLDRGRGMTRDELLQAREFAVSQKSIEQNVGFRGIGIYSGFDLCEKLVISTSSGASPDVHVLEIEFKRMRDILDEARKAPDRPNIPLARLLSENTYYRRESSDQPGESFTLVQLQELSDGHIHRLSDVNAMRDYILRNLPIRFSEDFGYGQLIEDALKQHVPGYKSARVILRVEQEPNVIVEKPNIPDLERPRLGPISWLGRNIGFYWACLVSGSDAISSRDFHKGRYQGFAGITYKVKGFSIGDRNVARQYIQRIPDWWTGEIHVTDTSVIPTSARDDFEANRAKDDLDRAVRELLNGPDNKLSLQRIALDAQARRAADRIFLQHEEKLNAIEAKIESGNYERHIAYAQLEDVSRILGRHKRKSSNREKEDQLLRKLKNLQGRVTKDLDQPRPVAISKRSATKQAMQAQEIDSEDTANNSQGSQAPTFQEATDEPDLEETTGNGKLNLNLLETIERTGWVVSDEVSELVEILDSAMADVLGVGSETYQRLLNNVQERLNEVIETA